MNLSKKKLFLIGFSVILLIGIPVSVYLLQKQQEVRSRAEKSTTIAFTPDSSATNPIQKNVGDEIPLDIMVNPGKNLVSYVKLEIQYDPEKLATAAANVFQANTSAFPTVFEGPIYSSGKISVTLSIGSDPTKAIQTVTKAATINLKAIATTPPGTPTLVTYGTTTQVLSIGSSDQASEDVLSTTTPATIVIGGPATSPTEPIPSGTPEPTTELSPTDVPSDTPIPTNQPTATPLPTTPPGGPGANNQLPICNSLVTDRAATGNPPFSITFTANGTDSDGTIGKITFNFGDGQVSDVTTGGGIGTASINVQNSHTYNNAGTYEASAILTDNGNGVSVIGNCRQTVTVQASSSGQTSGGGSAPAAPTATPTPTFPPGSPTPTMAATGSTEVAIGMGIGVMLLMIAGGFLFFVL